MTAHLTSNMIKWRLKINTFDNVVVVYRVKVNKIKYLGRGNCPVLPFPPSWHAYALCVRERPRTLSAAARGETRMSRPSNGFCTVLYGGNTDNRRQPVSRRKQVYTRTAAEIGRAQWISRYLSEGFFLSFYFIYNSFFFYYYLPRSRQNGRRVLCLHHAAVPQAVAVFFRMTTLIARARARGKKIITTTINKNKTSN